MKNPINHVPHKHHTHIHDHSHISRREALLGLGAAGIVALAPRPAVADLLKSQNTGTLFRIEKVSASVFAAIAKPQAMLNCNATVIVTADQVLVVDSHSKPSAARALIAQIRKEITDKPVRYCINSHFHWDHSQGNPAYPDVFGKNVEIVASTPTREWLAREGAPRLKQMVEGIPKQIEDLRKEAEKAQREANSRHPQLMQEIAELEAFQKEMRSLPIKLPTITFDRRMVLHQGGKEIHLIFLGRGHTAGDVVVYLPEEKVVATGDLMHSLLPYCGDSYPDEWPKTLTELEKIDFTRVASGHGSVQEGKSTLAFFRSYLEEVNEGVSRGIEKGTALKELQASFTPDKLSSLSGGGQVARLTKEVPGFRGNIPDPAGLLKDSVAANIAEIYNYYTNRKGKG